MFETVGYTLTTLLSEVGGLASFLYAFARFTARYFAREGLLGSLIQVLFRLKPSQSTMQEK